MITDDQLKNAANITVIGEDENVMVRASYIKELAQELLQRRQAEQKNLICWDLENMEEGGEDPDCLAEVTADSLRDDEERIIDVQVAVLLPNRKMRVWLAGGELREMKWEWTA